jgi:ABC-2 type transport system ATP-binding protein
MSAIEIKEFVKTYQSVEAVKGISLEVGKGELFGLIGPDGAGKTTLMRSICTLLRPTSGQILVNNMSTLTRISDIRRILGYMPQRFSLYQDLTVEQNLNFFADLFQVPREEMLKRREELYHFSKLEPFKHRKAGALSGGMKQKLALSCALIHTPGILILDEPTFGVDPVSRQEFWQILNGIKKQGTTILVSTAYMDEAERCDQIALMHQGKLITQGTPAEIKKQFPHPLYRIGGKDLRQLRDYFSGQKEVHKTQLFGDAIHVSFREKPTEEKWKSWQQDSSGNLTEWWEQLPSMEDVFMELTAGGIA